MIQFTPYPELESPLRRELAKHVTSEFGHVPFVQQRSWAMPDWAVIWVVHGGVATFTLVERKIKVDGVLLKAAGINNVITPAAHRGKGYASRLIAAHIDLRGFP